MNGNTNKVLWSEIGEEEHISNSIILQLIHCPLYHSYCYHNHFFSFSPFLVEISDGLFTSMTLILFGGLNNFSFSQLQNQEKRERKMKISHLPSLLLHNQKSNNHLVTLYYHVFLVIFVVDKRKLCVVL